MKPGHGAPWAASAILVLALALAAPAARAADAGSAAPAPVTNDSSAWIAQFGDNIWAQYHPDWEGWFPGGHSNRIHQLYVQNVWDHHPISREWLVTNKHWVFDGEWFAVEWYYRAKFNDDGFQQWESTLGIGHLKDGKLISWTEYFDDCVGNLQHLRLMPVYDIDEPIFPWPSKAILRMGYRP